MAGGSGLQQQEQASCTHEPRMIGSTTSTTPVGQAQLTMVCLLRQPHSRLRKVFALLSPPKSTSRFEKTARPVMVFGQLPVEDVSPSTR